MRSLWSRFKSLGRRMQIAVISAIVVFCCIIPYISGSLAPSSDEDESATQTPEEVVEAVIAEFTATIEPTATLTEAPTPTIEPSLTPTDLLPLVYETICLPQETKREIGRVIDVIDGDTIEVEIDGQQFRVRYIGMDTPEDTSKVEYCGLEASQRNKELVAGKEVTLVKDVSETDRYNRLLRYVLVGETFINYALVAEGYASPATYPPDVACVETFREAEQNARENVLGCWVAAPTLPQPPSPPPTLPPPPPPPPADTPPPAETNCHPAYPDVCLATNKGDYDCAGGSGNGPNYVSGPIRVLSPDPFDLDRDGDGIGCD